MWWCVGPAGRNVMDAYSGLPTISPLRRTPWNGHTCHGRQLQRRNYTKLVCRISALVVGGHRGPSGDQHLRPIDIRALASAVRDFKAYLHFHSKVDLDVSMMSLATGNPNPKAVPEPSVFSSLDPAIQAHAGFSGSHALSFQAILQAVTETMSSQSTSNVVVVGHSLGGAIALLGMSLSSTCSGNCVSRISYA